METADDRWRRVEALYHEMVLRPAHERAAALVAVCPGEPDLAAEVQSLLDQPESAAGFLATPAVEVAAGLVAGALPSLTGQRIGVFEIQDLLAVGGMGEVYRARDTKLGRAVAVKVLPEAFARDDERLARFDREARTLASLNHPNIAVIHGVEELPAADGSGPGSRALVMELVEGEDLSARIGRGAISTTEVLPIARQIAKALEAAHEHGIVHRDLKPANIKIRADGTVKVLDFGLAKVQAALTGRDQAALFQAPTGVGAVMGTPGYMSPEQIRGGRVDGRSDIFSFGVVLYEMLSGQRAFKRDSGVETMSATLTEEPQELSSSGRTIPPALDHVVRRCLAKEPRARWQSASDLAAELEWMSTESAARRVPFATHDGSRRGLLRRGAIAAVILVVAAVVLTWRSNGRRLGELRLNLSVPIPQDAPVLDLALTPDGKLLLYSGSGVVARALDSAFSAMVPGSETATRLFLSPHGDRVGFSGRVASTTGLSGNKLQIVPIGGGKPRVLADAPRLRGAAWLEDDTIVFAATSQSGLSRVPAGGGAVQSLTTLRAGEVTHRWPCALPNGRALFTVNRTEGRFDNASIEAVSVGTGERTVVLEQASFPRYAAGRLFFLREGVIFAAPFDARSLTVTGPPLAIVTDALRVAEQGSAVFAVSSEGTIAYQPRDLGEDQLQIAWLAQNGVTTEAFPERRPFGGFLFSRDGNRVATTISEGDNASLWVGDVARRAWQRITTGPYRDTSAVWSPDGRQIVFTSIRKGQAGLFRVPADGSAEPVPLGPRKYLPQPEDWSRSGWLVWSEQPPDTNFDIWAAPQAQLDRARPILATKDREFGASVSPDGKWLVFHSDVSGQVDVYAQPFPGPGSRQPVSTEGGSSPQWSADGRTIFYVTTSGEGQMIWRVTARTSSGRLVLGMPQIVLPRAIPLGGPGGFQVTQGDRFAVIRRTTPPAAGEIRILFGALPELH